MIDSLSKKLDVPDDQLRLVFCVLISYPIGVLNYYIKSPTIRLWYGFITGIALQYTMFGNDIIHIILATFLTYLFLRFYGRKLSPFYILGLTVAHLSYLHVYRMIVDYGGWKMDISLIYMMSICKFSSIAFSYEDGAFSDEYLTDKYMKANKIIECPTLLEVFSYVFYFPSSVVGPSFEFADFKKFIFFQDEYANIPMGLAFKEGLMEFLKSIICVVLFITMKGPFDNKYCITKEFGEKSMFYKFVYFNISMFVQRLKYYVPWKLSSSATIVCGLSYRHETLNPEKESKIAESHHKFDKVVNVVIRGIEWEINPKTRIRFWNRTVHLWLKYSVFMRLKGNKNAALIVFMVSAFWHGFYPIYYLFFFQFFILEQISGMLEKIKFFDRFKNANLLVQFIAINITQAFCNYLGITFTLIEFSSFYQFSKNVYFVPPILLFIIYFFLKFYIKNNLPSKPRHTQNEDENKTSGSSSDISFTPNGKEIKSN